MKKTMLKFLPFVAAIVFTVACGKDDDGNDDNGNVTIDVVDNNDNKSHQEVVEPQTNTVPIMITVGKNGQSVSKSTVEDGASGLVQKFIAGDVLDITGDVLASTATLTLKSGDENKESATFEGTLTLKDGASLVNGSTKLNAVLRNVSTEHPNAGVELTEIQQVKSLAEGFEKYGYLTANDFTYNGEATSITLVQNTAFLEFKTVMSRVPQVMVNGVYYSADEGLCYLAVPDKTSIKCGLLTENKTVDVSTGKVVYTINRTGEQYRYIYDFSVAADNIAALTTNADLVIIGEMTDDYYNAIGTALRGKTDELFKLDFSRSDYFTAIPNSGNGKGLSECGRFFAVLLPEGLEEVGSYAFMGCTQLVNESLPSTVKKIGMLAFAGCSAIRMFSLPESVEEMGMNVFFECTSLKAFNWNEKMTEIPTCTFAECTSLTAFGCNVKEGDSKFEIPSTVKTIGTMSFYQTGFKSVSIPSTVETMDQMVFAGCKELEEISDWGIKTIYWGTFTDCVNLKKLSNCKSVETIETSAFSGCTSLPNSTQFVIPKNVKRIRYKAFMDCGFDDTHQLRLEDYNNWFYTEDYTVAYYQAPEALNAGLYHNTTMGRISITHNSTSTYYLYIDNVKKAEWKTADTYYYMLTPGTHTIYVEQQDGYAFRPTKGTKTVTIKVGDLIKYSGPVSNTSTEYFN